MERLTEKDEQGNWCLKGVPWEHLQEGQVITKSLRERLYGALGKLMEYEDTGLTPEGAEAFNDFEKTQAAYWLKRLDEEQDKHRWIPVEEGLPKRSGVYNITRYIDGDYMCDLSYFDGQDTWHSDNRVNHSRRYLTDVIAWQSRPEPYHPPEEIEQLKDKATISKMENVGWIPVEERLPEKGEIVLVTIECDCGKTLFTNGVMFGFYKKGWFVSDDIELKKLKVTAWQPLPEPYREDEEN